MGYGYAGLAEYAGDLGFAQAGGVVFERQLIGGRVNAEAAQAVGVGELAEVAQLVIGERGLQFIGDFDECHGGIIAAGEAFSGGLDWRQRVLLTMCGAAITTKGAQAPVLLNIARCNLNSSNIVQCPSPLTMTNRRIQECRFSILCRA